MIGAVPLVALLALATRRLRLAAYAALAGGTIYLVAKPIKESVQRGRPQLHRIAAPTLLVAGGRDRFYSAALFRETAERIPDARLRLYQDKGHAGVMTHKPAIREVATLVRADQEAQNS